MAQHNQLATILDMVGLKADLRTKLYESLPHAWPQEVDRFLAALEALQVSESNLVIATLADVTDYMSRLIGGVDPKGRGLAAPPMLRDPASLALPAHELYRRFRRETHASLKRVERRRLVRGSQARSPTSWTTGLTNDGHWPVSQRSQVGRDRIWIGSSAARWG